MKPKQTETWAVEIAKEIIGKWGYEEESWWKPIAEALTQARRQGYEEGLEKGRNE
jgi:flagellar biosynthesis/type III secretory pathway protein FliH